MDGFYIHTNKFDGLKAKFVNLKMVNIDISRKRCKFFSHIGEFLGELEIERIDLTKIILRNSQMTLLRSSDENYMTMKISDESGEHELFYQRIIQQSFQIHKEECIFSDLIKVVDGYFFYLHKDNRGEPYLFPVINMEYSKLEYLNLLLDKIESLNSKK